MRLLSPPNQIFDTRFRGLRLHQTPKRGQTVRAAPRSEGGGVRGRRQATTRDHRRFGLRRRHLTAPASARPAGDHKSAAQRDNLPRVRGPCRVAHDSHDQFGKARLAPTPLSCSASSPTPTPTTAKTLRNLTFRPPPAGLGMRGTPHMRHMPRPSTTGAVVRSCRSGCHRSPGRSPRRLPPHPTPPPSPATAPSPAPQPSRATAPHPLLLANMRYVVVGGGILGLATARQLAAISPDADIVVLERSRRSPATRPRTTAAWSTPASTTRPGR